MISRREVVTAGVLGTLAGSTADLSAEARVERAKVEAAQDDAGIIRALNQIEQELERLNGVVDGTSRVTSGFEESFNVKRIVVAPVSGAVSVSGIDSDNS